MRGDHFVQHLVCVAVHALAEQPLRHVVSRGLAVLGLRRGERVGEDEAPHPLREEPVALHDDLAPHGQAPEDAALDPEMVEQADEVPGERRQGVVPGAAVLSP